MDPISLLLNPVTRKLIEDLYGGFKTKIFQNDAARRAVLRTHQAAKDAFRRHLVSTLGEVDQALVHELVDDRSFDQAISGRIMGRHPDRERCEEVTRQMLCLDDPDLFNGAWVELLESVHYSLVGSAELRLHGELLQGRAESQDSTVSELEKPTEPEESVNPRTQLDQPLVHGAEGGTVPLGSHFYLIREADQRMEAAVGARPATTLVVKGMRQSGKSSLLTRAIALARSEGRRTFYLDLQELDETHLDSLETLMRILALRISKDLQSELRPDDLWEDLLGAKQNFAAFLENAILAVEDTPVFLAFDEVDRVFERPYRADFFSAVRNWHNRRAEGGAWSRLSVAITHATDPALWIDDLNQSPFNVGESLALDPFTPEQTAEIGRRYGSPLDIDSLNQLYELLGGHPFLVSRAFWWIVSADRTFDQLRAASLEASGPFGTHLRQHVQRLERTPSLRAVVKRLTVRNGCESEDDFQRLRAAGLVSGERRRHARLACGLYQDYFRGHL